VKDAIGDRMKRYEAATRGLIPHRQPTIIRVDGKAFHSYTRGLERPWSQRFADAMDRVAIELCDEIQTAVMAYVQSDEISVLLHPYRRYQSQPWFDGEVQKTVSVAASIAGATMTALSPSLFTAIRPAYFDARVFVVPNETEAANCFLWRQQDATRNSIQMLARSLYSHKQCDQKNGRELQEMCWQKGHNWNDVPAYWKRGRCVVRVDGIGGGWIVDREIPIFSEQPEYITSRLAVDDEATR
jgi:tRNA(His) guanylyltransferase